MRVKADKASAIDQTAFKHGDDQVNRDVLKATATIASIYGPYGIDYANGLDDWFNKKK